MTLDLSTVKQELRQFIKDSFLMGDEQVTFADADSLMKNGIIDSTGVLELTAHLEEQYGVVLKDEEMVPSNLDSVDKLVSFIQRKLDGRTS